MQYQPRRPRNALLLCLLWCIISDHRTLPSAKGTGERKKHKDRDFTTKYQFDTLYGLVDRGHKNGFIVILSSLQVEEVDLGLRCHSRYRLPIDFGSIVYPVYRLSTVKIAMRTGPRNCFSTIGHSPGTIKVNPTCCLTARACPGEPVGRRSAVTGFGQDEIRYRRH